MRSITPTKRSTTVFLGFLGLLLLMGVLVVIPAGRLATLPMRALRCGESTDPGTTWWTSCGPIFYRASTLMRDYLVEADDAAAAGQHAELEGLQERNKAILVRYRGMVQTSEQESVRGI